MIYSPLSPLRVLERRHLRKADFLKIAEPCGQKIAIITDNAPIEAKKAFIASFSDKDAIVLDRVQPNPNVSDIQAMFSEAGFAQCSVIVGIGGGSVMDSAKALAMLKTNGGNLNDYLGSSPKRKIEERSAKLILIPTTAGTGSEVTKVGVYTSDSGRKYTLGSPLMHAHQAILVQDFIISAPPALVASTGLDALDHALESIWNRNAKPETLRLSRQAAIEVLSNLRKMYEYSLKAKGQEPKDQDYALSRAMLRASCKAGMAFNLTGTAAGHALSFVLSETWHVPHGTACAFTLNGVFELACSVKETRDQLALISAHFNPAEKDREKLVALLKSDIATLTEDLNQPKKFTDLGIHLSKDQIDSNFERSFDDPKMHNQLPTATKENIYPLLEKLC